MFHSYKKKLKFDILQIVLELVLEIINTVFIYSFVYLLLLGKDRSFQQMISYMRAWVQMYFISGKGTRNEGQGHLQLCEEKKIHFPDKRILKKSKQEKEISSANEMLLPKYFKEWNSKLWNSWISIAIVSMIVHIIVAIKNQSTSAFKMFF